MVEGSRDAITAIRDSAQEGFIAGALLRLGWNVVHRATSISGLEMAQEKYSTAIILASDDFLPMQILNQSRYLRISDIFKGSNSDKFKNPVSDFELQEFLRLPKGNEEKNFPRVDSIRGDVTVVASVHSGIGSSTLALNIAQEFAEAGESTLLLEVHQSDPYLSTHLSLQNINRGVTATPLGFSVGEVVSRNTLHTFSQEAEKFDRLVLDLGRLGSIQEVLSGNRMKDIASTWALQSASRILLLARGEAKSISLVGSKSIELEESPLHLTPIIAIMLASTLGRKERNEITRQIAARTNGQVSLYSRDYRSISKAESIGATLLASAPKSVMRGEILTQIIKPVLSKKSSGTAKHR